MRIVVLGATGYLGQVIFKLLKERSNDEIYGTSCKTIHPEYIQMNILKKHEINKICSINPDVIIWSIMDTDKEIELSQIGLKEIMSNISPCIRFIYVSTTVGKGKDQTEDIVPSVRTDDEYLASYINGKIEGETIVRKHSNHVIVRPGSIYGYDIYGKEDRRMINLRKKLECGEQYFRTVNMFASFVNVIDLANAIIELTYSDFKGIINIAGEKEISHYEFNIHLAKLMDINSGFIIPDYKQETLFHNLCSNKRKRIINTVIREIQ